MPFWAFFLSVYKGKVNNLNIKTFKNKVSVKIELCFKSKRERDLDNYFKAILDSFNGFLYEDDKLIYELSSIKKLGCDRDYFVIEVEELQQ